jgi:hypothetical protein
LTTLEDLTVVSKEQANYYEELIRFLRITPNPLDQDGISGVTIEWHPNPGYGQVFLFLSLTYRETRGAVMRRAHQALSGWEGELSCHASLIRFWIRDLEKHGIWEQDHYASTFEEMTMVDPQWYVIRIKDTSTKRDHTFCLDCPEQATEPSVRLLFRRIRALAYRPKWRFTWRCWLSSILSAQ